MIHTFFAVNGMFLIRTKGDLKSELLLPSDPAPGAGC